MMNKHAQKYPKNQPNQIDERETEQIALCDLRLESGSALCALSA
jgi:hypothetical protein